jgi:hypothetical protein
VETFPTRLGTHARKHKSARSFSSVFSPAVSDSDLIARRLSKGESRRKLRAVVSSGEPITGEIEKSPGHTERRFLLAVNECRH